MQIRKTVVGVLLILALVGIASAEWGVGLQADMISQGLAWRFLGQNGFGVELAGHVSAYPEQDSFPYNVKGELRVIKMFNTQSRVRFFAGGAAGAWMMRDEVYHWDGESEYWMLEPLTWGISAAALLGLDIIVIEMEDGSGITLMPEIQVGYYSFQDDEWWAGPGAGIGIRYVW